MDDNRHEEAMHSPNMIAHNKDNSLQNLQFIMLLRYFEQTRQLFDWRFDSLMHRKYEIYFPRSILSRVT